jgi:hypothetical protein
MSRFNEDNRRRDDRASIYVTRDGFFFFFAKMRFRLFSGVRKGWCELNFCK